MGHSLVLGLYVLLGRHCPLAPQMYRQRAVCQAEGVPFHSKVELMAKLIRSFEPVAGTHTHGLVDTWYSAKCIWQAGRERGFDITTGLKSNRALRVPDPTQPQGWRWQRLAEYVAHGRVIRAGRSLTVCAGDVVAINDEKETVVATMLATMMAVTAPA